MNAIDETSVVTYQSTNAPRLDLVWAAFVVLPDGNYWGIRFNGSTEEEAVSKAINLWNVERAKWTKRDGIADPWADVKADQQHHFANKVWMFNRETGDRKRIALTEITLYEKNGYIRGGPRSK